MFQRLSYPKSLVVKILYGVHVYYVLFKYFIGQVQKTT